MISSGFIPIPQNIVLPHMCYSSASETSFMLFQVHSVKKNIVVLSVWG